MALPRYFEIETQDFYCKKQWFLSNPLTENGEEILGEDFCLARPYNGPLPKTIPIWKRGERVAFSIGSLDMLVVTEEIAAIVKRMAPDEAEFFPVQITPGPILGYEIMNVLNAEPCIDEQRTDAMWWKEEDGRPDKTGTPRMVHKLVIDANRANGRTILRVAGWRIALLVSEDLRDELVSNVEDLGVKFTLVSSCPVPVVLPENPSRDSREIDK